VWLWGERWSERIYTPVSISFALFYYVTLLFVIICKSLIVTVLLFIVVEGCPDRRIAFWSGVCKSTGLFGTVLGMGFVALLRVNLRNQQFYQWGWRIPFLTSILVGCLGGYLRSFLKESEEFVRNQAKTQPNDNQNTLMASRASILAAIKFHWPEIISVSFIVAFWATCFYTSFVWMAYYTSQLIGDEAVPYAWMINTIMMGVFVFMMPCVGILADYICHEYNDAERRDVGYRRTMMLGAAIVVLFGMMNLLAYHFLSCLLLHIIIIIIILFYLFL
jgi:hypothetical protein